MRQEQDDESSMKGICERLTAVARPVAALDCCVRSVRERRSAARCSWCGERITDAAVELADAYEGAGQ